MIAFSERATSSTTPKDWRRLCEYMKAIQKILDVSVLKDVVQGGRLPMISGEFIVSMSYNGFVSNAI